MYSPSVLIISKRKELSIKYKKILNLLSSEVYLEDNLISGLEKIKEKEFEFIIISDTTEGNIKDFIKKIRILTQASRPTIIAVSKSDDITDRLDILNAGADDFLSETMQNREFQARLNAHIRRHIESLTNPLTGLLNEKLTRKVIKQVNNKEKTVSIILASIQNADYYREIYGEIAYEKVFQTIGAIITSSLTKEDAAGHYSQNEFLIITEPYRAEKLAEFLAFAFDNILKRFYTEFDFSNNFVMYSSSSKEEKKISLMTIIEAISEYDPNSDTKSEEIIQSLFNMLKPLKNSAKSTYIIDRPKLYGHVDNFKRNKILIMENDEALKLLIETSCTINGFASKICNSYNEFKKCLVEYEPDLIILDYGENKETDGILALEEAKKHYLSQNKKMPSVIFSTNIPDKKTILSHGADYYLPKPYDIHTLMQAVKNFLDK